MYYIKLDGKSSRDLGLSITKRPSFSAPKRRYEKFDIPGRDGELYIDQEKYDDLTTEISFNYIVDHDDMWHEKWRKCKIWLLKGGIRKLELSDDKHFYRKVKYIELSTNERSVRNAGEFSANIVTDPYSYVISGSYMYPYMQVRVNDYEVCKPIYYITGEGMCVLTVNGKSMNINVGQNIYIDTELQLAYRNDGVLRNTSVSGIYEDLYLLPGKNDIRITSGFELQIQPNWRCI